MELLCRVKLAWPRRKITPTVRNISGFINRRWINIACGTARIDSFAGVIMENPACTSPRASLDH
jgi:hypothetical protein